MCGVFPSDLHFYVDSWCSCCYVSEGGGEKEGKEEGEGRKPGEEGEEDEEVEEEEDLELDDYENAGTPQLHRTTLTRTACCSSRMQVLGNQCERHCQNV